MLKQLEKRLKIPKWIQQDEDYTYVEKMQTTFITWNVEEIPPRFRTPLRSAVFEHCWEGSTGWLLKADQTLPSLWVTSKGAHCLRPFQGESHHAEGEEDASGHQVPTSESR